MCTCDNHSPHRRASDVPEPSSVEWRQETPKSKLLQWRSLTRFAGTPNQLASVRCPSDRRSSTLLLVIRRFSWCFAKITAIYGGRDSSSPGRTTCITSRCHVCLSVELSHNLKEWWAVKLAPFILILDSMATAAPSRDPLRFGGGESGSFNTLFVWPLTMTFCPRPPRSKFHSSACPKTASLRKRDSTVDLGLYGYNLLWVICCCFIVNVPRSFKKLYVWGLLKGRFRWELPNF